MGKVTIIDYDLLYGSGLEYGISIDMEKNQSWGNCDRIHIEELQITKQNLFKKTQPKASRRMNIIPALPLLV